ncbi:hypothetical protein FKW77_005926 [Venturia effusa]|uniref:Uncharacterized protein n=1 Tax=Venturia effusa TaxID=50376 RepID=A0A517LCF7_9PEZI|nr:hypothetical protein FKW77_005926 [Venturia effusa]
MGNDHLTAQERQLYRQITGLLCQTDKLDIARGNTKSSSKQPASQRTASQAALNTVLQKPSPKHTRRQARALSMLSMIADLLVRRHEEFVLPPSSCETTSLLAIDGRQHLSLSPGCMVHVVESSVTPQLDQQSANAAFLQVLVEKYTTLDQHARHILGLLKEWHQVPEADQTDARMRLQNYVVFSCRERILEKFIPNQKDTDLTGYFELLTIDTAVFKEDRFNSVWPKQLWGSQPDILRRMRCHFSHHVEAEQVDEEWIERKTFHTYLRGALLGSFEALTRLVQHSNEIRAASKQRESTEKEIGKACQALASQVHEVTQKLCVLVDFVSNFGQCFKLHLAMLPPRLREIGKKVESRAFHEEAKKYIHSLGSLVHHDSLSVLGTHRHTTALPESLKIEVVYSGSEQGKGTLPALTSVLNEPCFGLSDVDRDKIEAYLPEHCMPDPSSSNQSIHPGMLLLSLWEHAHKPNHEHLLRTLSKYQTDMAKNAASCCRSCEHTLFQIVREDEPAKSSLLQTLMKRRRESKWPHLRVRKTGKRWKCAVLPAFLPREMGLLLLREAKLRLFERLHRIKRKLANSESVPARADGDR